MKYAYAFILCVMGFGMMLASRLIMKKDNTENGKAVRNLEIAAAVTAWSYMIAIVSSVKGLASFFHGIYFAASDWMLVYMLLFSERFTGQFRKRKIADKIMGAIVGVDCVSIALNAFFGHVFTVDEMEDLKGSEFYGISDKKFLYYLHMLIIYVIVVFILAVFIYKIRNVPAMYRTKYKIVRNSFIVVVAANFLSGTLELKYDLSLIFYGLLAVGVFYFSAYYIPSGVVQRMLSTAIWNMDDSVICYDVDGNCLFANHNARELFKASDVRNALYDKFYKECEEKYTLSEKNEFVWNEVRRDDGVNDKHYRVYFKHIIDDSYNFVGSFFSIRDETESVIKLNNERFKATHDVLTRIYNREYFYERAAEALADSEDGTYCMVSLDIKDFKLINDIFGVDVGDKILIGIAEAIKRCAGKGTIFGRLSGDRFAICMPRERFREQLFIDEINKISDILKSKSYHIHIHVGVYFIENNDMDVSVICDRARMAIRSIKSSYTDIIAYYDEKLRASRIGVQKITSDFSKAIREGQFCIYLQPQTSAENGAVLGGEALVRWMHPERGVVPPIEFISVFEQTGLICTLDKYVWELACKQLRKWKDEGKEQYHISVNISPKDFYFTDIFETFKDLVEKYEIDSKNLRLEITESAIMTDVQKYIELINKLRNYGFTVEMDDFGSGYSSLNTLKDINFDTIKIDMGFLRKTQNSERSRTILNNIIILSKQLGMEVITEGVETEDQVLFLKGAGCDIFQGYYFSKPMPVEDFESKYLDLESRR